MRGVGRLGALVLVLGAFGSASAAENTRIYTEDFDSGFEDRAEEWRGTGTGKRTRNPDEVIDGPGSFKIHGGKVAVTHPELRVTAGSTVRLAFDFRLTDQPEKGAIPHSEARIVGFDHLTPYLKMNFSRQDHRFGRKAGKVYRAESDWFTFPFADDVRLIFRCIGPGALVVDNIRVHRRTQGPPDAAPEGAPSLRSPTDGEKMSLPALKLRWRSTESARESAYRIQLARSEAFPDPVARTKKVSWRKQRTVSLLPGDGLGTGKWHWRVRAVNRHGKSQWSGTGTFVLAEDRPPQSPPYRPSPEAPLFILEGHPKRWAEVPEDLKPYTFLKLRGLRQLDDRGRKLLEQCERRQIPVLGFRFPPGPELERAFRRYDCMKGVVVAEGGAHGYHIGDLTTRVGRLIRLAARHGKIVLWQDGQWRQLVWAKAAVQPSFYRTMKKYPGHFVPQVKHNFAFAPLASNTTLMGLRAAGVVDAWGVQVESWYYHPWRDRADFPPALYAQMTAAAASAGATVFSYEPPGDLWADRGNGLVADRNSGVEKGLSKTFRGKMVPLFRALLEQGAIPTREEILDRAKVGILLRKEDAKNVGAGFVGGGGITWGSGDFFPIFDGVYGMRHHAETIPNTGRSYLLPLVSALVPPGQRPLPHLLRTDQFDTAEAFGKHVRGSTSPPQGTRGKGYVTRVGNTSFAIHGQEFANRRLATSGKKKVREEHFVVEPGRPYARKIRGDLGLHQSVLIAELSSEVRIHCVNRREATTVLTVVTDRRPAVRIEGPGELGDRTWSDEGLRLRLDHADGSATVVLSSGTK